MVLQVPHHVVRTPNEQADDHFAEVAREECSVGAVRSGEGEEQVHELGNEKTGANDISINLELSILLFPS